MNGIGAMEFLRGLFLVLLLGTHLVSAAEPVRLYGTLQMPLERAAAERASGLRVALVAVAWARFEPKPGKIDQHYVDELLKEKKALAALGYKLMLDLGVQYAPAWVFELPHGRYKNQYGDTFATKQSGEDVPNVVFNAEVRRHEGEYFGEVFARLGKDWDYVRLGCAKFGELNYPRHEFDKHTNCYWAFDDIAQGKATGLPAGMSPCPVPGWIPGTRWVLPPLPETVPRTGHFVENNAPAKKFVNWYLDCLKHYQDWQIITVRKWYAGDLCMLYGSWGIRPGQWQPAIAGDLDGKTSAERNGEIQQGFSWARMIAGINDPRVIVYCTWMDATLQNRDISDDNSSDPARWSPVHWLASLARENPLKLRVWGENTGQNNHDAMRLTFDRVKRFDLMGIMWAFDGELYASPNPKGYAKFSDYEQFIRDYQ